MAEPFLSEIRIFSFNFPPRGWALCNGQLLLIQQNQALFSLLGTTYGGNGMTNFALPNLQGRVPIHVGNGHTLGEAGGQEGVTLTTNQLPTHTHLAIGSANAAGVTIPSNNLLSQSPAGLYAPPASLVALDASSVSSIGGSQAHENRQPYLTLNFCIALQGIFPSWN